MIAIPFAKKFFNNNEANTIAEAVTNAEKKTSGEIRVHIAGKCKEDVLDCAAAIFRQLGMDKTSLRNGVLIYLAVDDHKFAIIGDSGINAVVPANFWDIIKEKMQLKFKEHQFVEGLCEGIAMTGEYLKKHFPYQQDDINQLPNDVSY